MATYIVRRLAAMAGMLIALSIIVFLIFSALPVDPARLTCGKSCSPQIIAANRVRLGLDQPLITQYDSFVKAIFVGRDFGSGSATFRCGAPCLGYSFRQGADVTSLITKTLPVTAQIAVGAFILWMIFGILTGIYASLRRGTWKDRSVMGFALIGYSFPSFFIGLIFIFFVQIKLRLIGFGGYVPFATDPKAWFVGLLGPWITLALLYAAFYARLTRNQMLETMGEDFIRTARAKGLREGTVIGKHGLRAGLTPLVTAAGLDLAGLLGGAIVTEQVFNMPGMGRLAVQSVLDSDLPIITAVTLIVATFIIVANLIVDVLYAVVDPRVRLT